MACVSLIIPRTHAGVISEMIKFLTPATKNLTRVNNQPYVHSLYAIKQYVTMSVTHSSSLNYSALYRHKALLLNSTTEPPFCSLNDAQARLSVCASPPGIHISPVTCVREYTYHCDTGK